MNTSRSLRCVKTAWLPGGFFCGSLGPVPPTSHYPSARIGTGRGGEGESKPGGEGESKR